eukprot:scaffold75499_cov59-Phaeocystis_antarctica.AAC.1
MPEGVPGEGSDEQVSVFCTRSAPSVSLPLGPTDWPVELEGGPGGSDAVDRRLVGSDVESSAWTCTLTCTW